jgi:hypothetical protein
MLSQAAARRNITLVINENDLVPALQRVHERFFGAGLPAEAADAAKAGGAA